MAYRIFGRSRKLDIVASAKKNIDVIPLLSVDTAGLNKGWTVTASAPCLTMCARKREFLCSLPSLFSSKPNCPWIVWLGNSALVSTIGCKTQRGKRHTFKEAFYSCWPQSLTYLLLSENVWYWAHNKNSKNVLSIVITRYYEKKMRNYDTLDMHAYVLSLALSYFSCMHQVRNILKSTYSAMCKLQDNALSLVLPFYFYFPPFSTLPWRLGLWLTAAGFFSLWILIASAKGNTSRGSEAEGEQRRGIYSPGSLLAGYRDHLGLPVSLDTKSRDIYNIVNERWQ